MLIFYKYVNNILYDVLRYQTVTYLKFNIYLFDICFQNLILLLFTSS